MPWATIHMAASVAALLVAILAGLVAQFLLYLSTPPPPQYQKRISTYVTLLKAVIAPCIFLRLPLNKHIHISATIIFAAQFYLQFT